MARYIFMKKEDAIEKGIVQEDTTRMISKDGETICLLEDDLLTLGNDKEATIETLECEVLEQKKALEKVSKEF